MALTFINLIWHATIEIVDITRDIALRHALAAKLICIATAMIVAGCSGGKEPTYPARGTIAFSDGKPLTTGWVSFRSLDSGKNVTARGPIQSDGSFELTTFFPADGAVEGRHQALVAAVPFQNEREVPINTRPPPPLVDQRFSSFQTSGLEFVVSNEPEKNWFEIQVTPPKKR